MFVDCPQKTPFVDRLEDQVVDPCRHEAVSSFRDDVRGERDDRDGLSSGLLTPDQAGGLQAVDDRHVHIHQDDVVLPAGREFIGLLTVAGGRDLRACGFEQFCNEA